VHGQCRGALSDERELRPAVGTVDHQPEVAQQPPALGEAGRVGRVEPPQPAAVGVAPTHEVEGEGHEVGVVQLGGRARLEAGVLVLGPQPQARPRTGAPRPSGALRGA
jgi:hypothetical protein